MKWATRKNMKVDRVSSAWLIRKFVDPQAEFFFFEESAILAEAKKIGARTFDVAGADYGHEGMRCTFETTMTKHGLWGKDLALDHMAQIINCADVLVKLYDFRPLEGFGIWALAQGFADCMPDDGDKLKFAVPMYEALYHWCRRKLGGMKQSVYQAPAPPKAAKAARGSRKK